mgnify:CR=1 FL=1
MIINLFKATTGSLKIGNLSIAKRSKAITANVIKYAAKTLKI